MLIIILITYVCLAIYYLPEGFESKPAPYGNSKSCKPFYPTLPSTLMKIKEECAATGPKQVIVDVSASLGGNIAASDACKLPRDEQQVSQAKLRLKSATLALLAMNFLQSCIEQFWKTGGFGYSHASHV